MLSSFHYYTLLTNMFDPESESREFFPPYCVLVSISVALSAEDSSVVLV